MDLMDIWTLVAVYILIFLSLANLFIKPILFAKRMAGKVLKKLLRVRVPENQKKGVERLYTPIWVIIGLWAFFKLKDASLLGAVFGLLAFRSGANITRLLVYSSHDGKILKEMAEGRVLGILEKAVRISLILEAAFPFAMLLAYKTLSAVTISHGSVGKFLLELWVAGAIFGLVFGYLIAKDNRGLLLEDSVEALTFMIALKGKQKAEKAKERIKFRAP
ncbi:hypothetical protein [Thermococcus kodakarensis]|nr:hypothetical protein [Thermococcus kodakarensis]WCN27717.1 hypothetical protein POG15_09215 [Thermococcus kodakarensis]WCN30010.1 hypothetical protein POG21_09200 [Thermococcus kodakarensis]